MYFRSLFLSPRGGWSVSRLQHQPLCGKHNTETNHSQVSGHWSSVISDELMAPLNGQQGSLGNISMYLSYWSPFCVKNSDTGCWKTERLSKEKQEKPPKRQIISLRFCLQVVCFYSLFRYEVKDQIDHFKVTLVIWAGVFLTKMEWFGEFLPFQSWTTLFSDNES